MVAPGLEGALRRGRLITCRALFCRPSSGVICIAEWMVNSSPASSASFVHRLDGPIMGETCRCP